MTVRRRELLQEIVSISVEASKKWQIHSYTLVFPCLTPWLRLFDRLEDARFRINLERPLELDFPVEVDM